MYDLLINLYIRNSSPNAIDKKKITEFNRCCPKSRFVLFDIVLRLLQNSCGQVMVMTIISNRGYTNQRVNKYNSFKCLFTMTLTTNKLNRFFVILIVFKWMWCRDESIFMNQVATCILLRSNSIHVIIVNIMTLRKPSDHQKSVITSKEIGVKQSRTVFSLKFFFCSF